MGSRVQGQKMPQVQIVPLAKDKRSRPDLFLTDPLISALRSNLEQSEQSLLFVNRRGFASFMMCGDCGYVIDCRHCQVSLTKHKQRGLLICHYCGFTLTANTICPACNSTKLIEMGVGSERIEQEVRQHFPEARVARLDSDTAKSSKQYLQILQKVRERGVDILVGTQMIAKGLHFPHVTLVGVVWADTGLAMPHYKAAEATYQLLAQVTGRAGRGEKLGRVIIQTHQPQHYAVQCAREHDYQKLYEQEIELRQKLKYPPFSRLVNIRCSDEDEQRLQAAVQNVAEGLRGEVKKRMLMVEVLGPAPAPLARIRNRSRWQILLKAVQPRALHLLCEYLLENRQLFMGKNVQMTVDVDPENMM
jgi:primosomal protein N' (replication factor Y)